MKCPICNTETKQIGLNTFINKKLKLMECPNCELIMLDLDSHKISQVEIDLFYRNTKYYVEKGLFLNLRKAFSRLRGQYYKAGAFLDQSLTLRDLNILELGCGRGEFLKELQRDNFCIGVDSNKHYYDLYYKGSLIDFYNLTIEGYVSRHDLLYDDLIILADVLEHLSNPVETLSKIHTKTSNRVKLYIKVPNCGDGVIMQKSLKEPHISHFTTNSILELLDKTGFKAISMQVNIAIFLLVEKKPKDLNTLLIT